MKKTNKNIIIFMHNLHSISIFSHPKINYFTVFWKKKLHTLLPTIFNPHKKTKFYVERICIGVKLKTKK